MSRTLVDARAWTAIGDEVFAKAVQDLTDEDLRQPSTLPDWSVGNLVAHVAANGDALLNLVSWAKTGIETPMYACPEDRAAGIARGNTLTAGDARSWLAASTAALNDGLDGLTDTEWTNHVVTAQGRNVPATELPYMRSREVLIHAVDLDRGIGFADLPDSFLDALVDDICAKRGIQRAHLPPGAPPDVAAWLAGRPHRLHHAPDIGPWL